MKSLPWFRFYADALYDPKVQRLSGQTFKNWVNCLCLAAKGGGILPPLPDIAFALRMSESEAKAAIDELRAARLLDQTEAGLMPHNWSERQYQSDISTPRTKKHRERKRSGNVPGTFQGTLRERSGNGARTDRDTEQIQNRTETEPRQNRIASTVEEILDWQAFCIWAGCGLKRNQDAVLEAIEERAPGLLDQVAEYCKAELDQGRRCSFYDELVPALLVYGLPLPTEENKPALVAALSDPRQDRMQTYLERCTENPSLCEPWPDFETWRTAAWAGG
jgi:hypothetical protein